MQIMPLTSRHRHYYMHSPINKYRNTDIILSTNIKQTVSLEANNQCGIVQGLVTMCQKPKLIFQITCTISMVYAANKGKKENISHITYL